MLPPVVSLSLPQFISLSFLANMPVLVGILAVFFILYMIVTGVLWYHWSKYGMHAQGILVGRLLFSIISVALFGMAVTGLILF